MANVLFKPRTLVGATPQPVYLIYRFGRNEKLAFPTGLKINPQHWNKRNSRARDLVECTTKDIINARLNQLEAETDKFVMHLKAEGKQPTKENLRDFLNNLANPKNDKPTFADFINEFTSNGTTKINPTTGRYVTLRTVQGYQKFRDYFAQFEATQKRKYDFENIDLDFYEDFTAFLRKVGLSTNTIGKSIRLLKTVLNEATEKGINQKTAYKSHRFKVVEEESDTIYLNENELNQLYNFDFSNNKRLERVRDLFLVGAWTGLRFSDFTRISRENIKGNFIEIEQQKTGKRVLIPLHPVVSEIWQKYGEKSPPNITNQKLNDYIKEVCQKVGITEHEQKAITKGGVKTLTRYEKWKLVSSHTARRSFATNLFLSGFPTLSIMQVTGHRTEKAFMRYIKVTPEQHAVLLREHWAQNGNFLRIAK
ncbi:MAG: site-specific integrase [Prevotellaceae bacterium]|jgi:site-specific recombinase XerD|nr:site-specific integrase [Prevotellaceae bacterium]